VSRCAKIGEVADVVAGVGFPKEMQGQEEGEIPVFKVGDISTAWLAGEGVLRTSRNYLTGDHARKLGKPVPAGSTVFAKIGEALRLNRRAILGQPSLVDNNVMGVVPRKDALAPLYLFYFMQTVDLGKLARATAVPSVRKSDVVDIGIPLPSLAEQERVVAEFEKQFSRLDDAVANLKRAKTNLKRYKAAVLQDAVDGRLHGGVSRGAESPAGWGWGTCGDVIESIQAGASFKCAERPPIDGEVGVVKVSAVTWGEFDERESKTCLDPERVREALFIRSGDFLFSRANTIELVGACVIAKTVTKSLMLSDKILRFRLAPRLDPCWLLICLQSRFGRSEIERLATGNQESMRNIGQDRIRQIRLPLPALAEQRLIATEVDRRLSIVREAEGEVDASLRRAQKLRGAVLANGFRAQ
jgi:type I restriction enzyme, S subunit